MDDPATGKKVPTCHRSTFDRVMEDVDFEQALEHSDTTSWKVYRDEAKQIEEIRKRIVAVSNNEEPYDIFICYKETDELGNRTIDSVLAQDVYNVLTDNGYRVFFSRITLEDKLGVEYEPYIFAALNSAKIMLVVGTCYEHFNAVWVKNEWSRYMKLMATDREKRLFPCYKDITPYDLPKDFRHLQGQDLGKIGALQDLLRGIEKCLPLIQADSQKQFYQKKTPVELPVQPSSAETTRPPVKENTQQQPETQDYPKTKRQPLLRIALLVILAAALAIGCFNIIAPAWNYANAEGYFNRGQYLEAAALYATLGDYKDARSQATKARISYLKDTALTFSIEDYIVFGSYEQNNKNDGKEPIEWFPLAISDHKVLLISRYALDYLQHNESHAFLNNEFIASAFTTSEQKQIVTTENDYPIITEFFKDELTISGNEGYTTDQVFLLSAPEVVSYFGNSSERFTKATPYAKSKGAYVAENGNTWWSLRTTYVTFVGAESGFGSGGASAIRPAIWIEIP